MQIWTVSQESYRNGLARHARKRFIHTIGFSFVCNRACHNFKLNSWRSVPYAFIFEAYTLLYVCQSVAIMWVFCNADNRLSREWFLRIWFELDSACSIPRTAFSAQSLSLLLGLSCCTHRTRIPFKTRALRLFVAVGTTRYSPAIFLASLTCYRQ